MAIAKAFPAICLISIALISCSHPCQHSMSSNGGSPLSQGYDALRDGINVTAIVDHVRFFSSLQSRAPGYPDNQIAAQYVMERFQEYGLEEVHYQFFDLVVPLSLGTYGANLTVISPTNITYDLYAFEPNVVATGLTDPEGITGRLLYVRKGEYRDLDGKNLTGTIVLMDYGSYDNWVTAASLGARAVIFIEPTIEPAFSQSYQKFSPWICYNYPRLYVPTDDAIELLTLARNGETIVNLKSNMRWTSVTSQNVLGTIRGTGEPERFILVTAHYDAWSVVPAFSPGAQEAIGIATLLEMARLFQETKPYFSMVFLATSGHSQFNAGMREWIDKTYFGEWWNPADETWTVENRKKMIVQADFQPYTDSGIPMIMVGIQSDHNIASYQGSDTPYLVTVAQRIENELLEYKEMGVSSLVSLGLTGGSDWDAVVDRRYIIRGGDGESAPRLPDYESEPIFFAGGIGFTFTTALLWRQFENTPFDTFDNLQLDNLPSQVKWYYCFLYTLAMYEETTSGLPPYRPGLSPKVGGIDEGFRNVKGQTVFYNTSLGFYSPVPNTIIAVRDGSEYDGDWDSRWPIVRMVALSDETGTFILPNVHHARQGQYFEAFKIDETTGEITHAMDLGRFRFAFPNLCNNLFLERGPYADRDRRLVNIGYVVLFECATVVLHGISYDQQVRPNVLSITTHSSLDSYGYSPLSVYGLNDLRGLELVFVPTDISFEIINMNPMIVLRNTTADGSVSGYTLSSGEVLFLPHSHLTYAEELFLLDESRLAALLRSNVEPLGTVYHEQTRGAIQRASESIGNLDYSSAFNHSVTALGAEREAYSSILTTVLDTVNTLPFFAAILLPFVYVVERLLVSAEGRNQMFVIAGIYMLSCIIFYFIHPGFILASNSVMVLLGMIIIILILPIFVIVFQNTMFFLRKIRRKHVGLHVVERSRIGEISSAFFVGNRLLKRRRLATVLTLCTITLVVASLVAFTSAEPRYIVQKVPVLGIRPPDYSGILIKDTITEELGAPLSLEILQICEQFKDKAVIASRWWHYAVFTPEGASFKLTFGNKSTTVAAFLGLTPQEVSTTRMDIIVSEGRYFTEEDVYSCLISERTAEELGIDSFPSKMVVGQKSISVIGTFTSSFLEGIYDFTGRKITPQDKRFPPPPVPTSASETMIITANLAKELGGALQAVALKFQNEAEVEDATKTLFDQLKTADIMLYVSVEGTVSAYSIRNIINVTGLEFQMIPFIIGVLVILDTCMGAVSRRIRLISIFNAIGLSPSSVAMMFIVETLIYAVIGGVIGYVGAVLLCSYAYVALPGFQLNYTSAWTVVALGIAMLASIISSLYPSFKASRLSVPSAERKWKITTKPYHDTWSIPLPFASTTEELDGAIYFTTEFLNAHRLERSETFYITDMSYSEGIEKRIITFTSRLVPYDAGLKQENALIATIGEDGRWHYEINIERKAGNRKQWQVSNRVFADEIRKQLLLWRGLAPSERAQYIAKAEDRKKKGE